MKTEEDEKDSPRTIGLGCLTMLAIVLFGMASRLFAVVTLWTWFVVPLGAPVVGYASAFGLLGLVGVIRGSVLPDNTPKDQRVRDWPWGKCIGAAIAPLVSVALAWCVT